MHLFRHGDDILGATTQRGLDWLDGELRKGLRIKLRGILGPGAGQVQELTILNRLVRWVAPAPALWAADTGLAHLDQSRSRVGGEQLELEADPRHVEIAAASLGLRLGQSNGVRVPGARPSADERRCSRALVAEDARAYRSTVMRLAYLAGDRPDLAFAVKELARQSKEPREVDLCGLKKLVRYLINRPRLVLVLRRQEAPERLVAYTDSDHAGCVVSRRSTSSYVLFWGCHCLRAASGTQKVQALSSAEAEFYAATRGASGVLGATRLMGDLGLDLLEPHLLLDATGGLGIAGRRGVGPVKHLATASLWLQSAVFRRDLTLGKVASSRNVADGGTKVLPESALSTFLALMGYEHRSGRSALALESAWARAQAA